jgi:hypothetical protein
MHGTYVEERKLVAHTRERLISGDFIRFGAEVTRGPGTCWINDEPAPYCCSQPIRWLPLSAKGDLFNDLSESNPLPESFPPLEMCISFDWIDEAYVKLPPWSALTNAICRPQSVPNVPTILPAETSRNSFSVPDYDDDDDEIEIIYESVRTPRVEVVVPSHRYTVPESDLSCAGSFTSDSSSSSEPPTPSPRASRTDLANWKQNSGNINEKSPEDVLSSHTAARERLTALSDAPSAAGFFHFSVELPPAYHQALSQPKPAAEHETVPTMTDSVHSDEDVLDDEDLTESDVEFADGSSDDLFGDDGESAQQGLNAESPPPSEFEDSDEELEASNRGTKLMTYTKVLRPFGVGEEDHITVPATERGPGASSSILSPLLDNTYPPNPTSDQQNLVQKPPNNMNDARAPSPSDAAMAKTTTAQLPPMEAPIQFQSPFVVPMTSDFPRLSSTEAPYTRPTWAAWQGYTAEVPSEYTHYVSSPFNSHFPYQEGPFGYRQTGDLMNTDDLSDPGEENLIYKPATSKSSDQPIDSTRFPTYPLTTATAPDADQNACVLGTTNLRATKLSIDDIVEKNTQEVSAQRGGQKLKRKADDMSTDEDASATALALSDAQVISELGLAPQAAESTQSATSQTVMPPTTDAELVVPTQTMEAVEQPARKRAKTGVAKYAAAVFAGVLAGGVGTMAALLALPPI